MASEIKCSVRNNVTELNDSSAATSTTTLASLSHLDASGYPIRCQEASTQTPPIRPRNRCHLSESAACGGREINRSSRFKNGSSKPSVTGRKMSETDRLLELIMRPPSSEKCRRKIYQERPSQSFTNEAYDEGSMTPPIVPRSSRNNASINQSKSDLKYKQFSTNQRHTSSMSMPSSPAFSSRRSDSTSSNHPVTKREPFTVCSPVAIRKCNTDDTFVDSYIEPIFSVRYPSRQGTENWRANNYRGGLMMFASAAIHMG